MKLYEPSTIKYLKNKYGFKFSKNLGQNFLTEGEVIEGIVESAGIIEDDLVIEIGPGIGVLTVAAAERAGKVIAIEIDRELQEILAETLQGHDNIEVIFSDVMKLDLAKLIEEERRDYKSVKVLGNLPYYITTPILMKLIESRLPVESITVMMQKEVAERIDASPGGRTYGAISVAVQYYCDVEIAMEVPKDCFMPIPKVDSAVLHLTVREKPAVAVNDEKMFFRVVKAGFSQRRKTLLNSLQTGGFSKDLIKKCLDEAGIEQTRRAETLSLEDFAKFADNFLLG